MNENIRRILMEITRLQEELATVINEQQAQFNFRIEGTRIRFEENLRQLHQQLRTGVFAWLRTSELRNVVTAPIIYLMIFPFALLDLALFLYQSICFPLYRIPKVRRSLYIVVDRHNLDYLNVIEKLNCVYCGYIDGLLGYARQIVSRTELYWCPIKHARKVLDPHRQYALFADFGDGEAYHAEAAALRKRLESAPEDPHDTA